MTCSLCYARYVLCHHHQNSRAETYPDPRWDHMYSTYLEDWFMRKEEIKTFDPNKRNKGGLFCQSFSEPFFYCVYPIREWKLLLKVFCPVSSEVNDRKLDSWVDRDVSFECFHVMTSINGDMTCTNTYRGSEYCADGTVRSPWLKEVKGSKTARNAARNMKHNHHQPLPLVTTTLTPSGGVSHGAQSVVHSALQSSASLSSQDQDLSLSRSLTRSVWSRPRCLHLQLWLNHNDICQTQPHFSWASVKPASDSDCLNEGSLVSVCVDCGFTRHRLWCINISIGRMEMNGCL